MNDLAEKTSTLDTTIGPEERGFVYAVARRIVGSPEDAEDVTQEALLLAHRHRDSYRGEARFRTWLYRIASTAALGHLRRRRRSREVLAPTTGALAIQVPDQSKSPESALAEAESARLVTMAVAGLDPKYRDVVMCRASASDAETASQLGITVANVKIRAHRARKQLRPVLEALR
ncbi:MAG: sigma-70 family RNA polymerase sigma factor [Kofleriaceae bacterium]|nr:sigma-70 family RNA polymerase sigma factor [Kofleriaceae bacterium]